MSSPPPFGPDRAGSGWDPESWPRGSRGGDGRAAPLSDPLVPPDLRGWFDRIVGVIQRSLMPLLGIQLCVAVAIGLISYLILPELPGQPGGGRLVFGSSTPLGPPDLAGALPAVIGMILAFGIGAFGQCASIFVALRDAAKRSITAEQVLRFAARRAPGLLGWEIVAGLAIFFGLIGLIAPGVYLFFAFGASLIAVVTIERGTPIRCFQLLHPQLRPATGQRPATAGRIWPTVGRLLLATLVAVIYELVGSFVIGALSSPGTLPAALLSGLVGVPIGIASVAFNLVTYAELRFHENPSILTATLADELDSHDRPDVS